MNHQTFKGMSSGRGICQNDGERTSRECTGAEDLIISTVERMGEE